PGELYIGGSGVAVGYAASPKQTAERFVPHPETGERMYATGDQGRYWPDGRIEFLGRLDRQVKGGGYRVELAGVESGLHHHPGVRAAAVTAPETPDGRHLVAWIVPSVAAVDPSPGSPAVRLPSLPFDARAYAARQTNRDYLDRPISLEDFARLLSVLGE